MTDMKMNKNPLEMQMERFLKMASDDPILSISLHQLDEVSRLLSDEPTSDSERFRLPYSSVPELRPEDIWTEMF